MGKQEVARRRRGAGFGRGPAILWNSKVPESGSRGKKKAVERSIADR
jgi:hypothetical protein